MCSRPFSTRSSKCWQGIQAKRRKIWERYDRELAEWAERAGVQRPFIPEHCEQAWHMYYLLLPSLESRHAFVAHLRSRGVPAVFHYLPLHLSAYGSRWGGKAGDCPVTESVSDRLLRLPFYNHLTADDQTSVIKAVLSFPATA